MLQGEGCNDKYIVWSDCRTISEWFQYMKGELCYRVLTISMLSGIERKYTTFVPWINSNGKNEDIVYANTFQYCILTALHSENITLILFLFNKPYLDCFHHKLLYNIPPYTPCMRHSQFHSPSFPVVNCWLL